MRRLRDTILVLISAPVWLPVAAITAAAVLAVLGRPVFFVQKRAGRNGKPFNLVKFRSMRTGSGSDAERLGRFGRFLRATSMDELPELFLVLAGKMSLVGPRPLPVEYLPRYSPEQARRHEVPPGITGWAQVNGRNDTTWQERFARDVWYVDNRSHLLDAKIIFMTLIGVFTARGVSRPGEATMDEFKGNAKGDAEHA